MREKTRHIRGFILANVDAHPQEIARVTADFFSISRQAVQRHLRALVDVGLLRTSGKTRSRRWIRNASDAFTVDLAEAEEDKVWRLRILPLLPDRMTQEARARLEFAFTEIMNNAIDHSETTEAEILAYESEELFTVSVKDKGVGIFAKIQRDKGLEDERHALLELSKGKLTTDEENHSGEGIFFSSRAADYFTIVSHDLNYISHDGQDNDFLLHRDADKYQEGTSVIMRVALDGKQTMKEIFDEFAMPEEYTFAKTIVPVRLATYEGTSLVSRSQARRLLARVNQFRVAILDFEGVDMVGQAFADEAFRVFAAGHPETELVPVNMTSQVEDMVERALRQRQG